MTEAELQAIQAHRYDWWNCGCPEPEEDAVPCGKQAIADRDALLAEVRRLKQLVEAAFKEGYNEGLGDGHPLSRGADSQKRWVESNAEYDLSGGIR